MNLFDIPEAPKAKKVKKPRLGRYENVMKLVNEEFDPFKTFVEFEDTKPPQKRFNFIDLFSGAGGMTLGFSNAGFNPVGSVEINPFASATHRRNFPSCEHFCGEIQEFIPEQFLGDKRRMYFLLKMVLDYFLLIERLREKRFGLHRS